MTIILDSYAIPEKGEFEVYVKRAVNLQVSAEEARRKVNHWLLDQVSHMMGAEAPQLVLQENCTIWQVPAILTANQLGRIGVIGFVAVHVETGELLYATATRTQLLQAAETLVAAFPAYQPRTEMPPGYDPTNLPPISTPKSSAAMASPSLIVSN